MKGLNRQEGILYVDEVPLNDIAKKYGTPTYVYSASKFIENLNKYLSAVKKKDKICYSVKSNSNIHILNLLSQLGCGFDVVSGNELKKCLEAGAKPENIVFSGVGKTKEEITLALEKNIFSINIESEQELDRIIEISKKLDRKANCIIRVNPDIAYKSHPHIQTGLKTSKFGVLQEFIEPLARKASQSGAVRIIGVASHIGSQIFDENLILGNLEILIELTKKLLDLGHQISYLDLGGGLGITYKKEEEISPNKMLNQVLSRIRPLKLSLIVEPGRTISGNAGILMCKVEYLKKTPELNFAIINSGMNDLLRPSLYQAWHDISVVEDNSEDKLPYKVVGPVCESGDTFGEDRILNINKDSLLAIHDVGAYGHVMSSNYNSRFRPPEILVEGSRMKIIRRRETFDDLLIQERDV